jgi:rhamnogalacturonyl hydrolase YesR
MILALLEIYQTTGKHKYLDFADTNNNHRVQEDGIITSYKLAEYNIDNVNGLSAIYWLRALDWYSMALLDTLDKCDITGTGMERRYGNLRRPLWI